MNHSFLKKIKKQEVIERGEIQACYVDFLLEDGERCVATLFFVCSCLKSRGLSLLLRI